MMAEFQDFSKWLQFEREQHLHVAKTIMTAGEVGKHESHKAVDNITAARTLFQCELKLAEYSESDYGTAFDKTVKQSLESIATEQGTN